MPRAYVIGYRSRTWPDDARKVDVDFAARLDKAYCWESREIAERECVMLELLRVEVVLETGAKHTCTGFKVDELGLDMFVVFCEVPFLIDSGGKATT